ncbi:MAG: AAA family ATPase [Bacillota bacterium]
MKPVRLEFSGLQSYRELQVIDFADLLGGGLFGIFGPTGAGKSTILDAITLALYGRVERAKGTAGIMNQAEKRLTVKFQFVLGEGHAYRVERSYKREKETESIRTEHCRLIELVGGLERVLADKDGDVNRAVMEILGLTLDDFTRAVVLPQGQFAEFLHLSGRERTQMLQRIFSLSQYGDKLNQRLKRRIEMVTGQLTRVQGEQAGLGDASAEAVDAAAAALRAAEERVVTAQQELDAVEQQFRAWEKVWELQQELAGVAADLGAWQGRAPEADGWRQELAAARRAEEVRPHLAAERQARSQAEQAAVRLAEVEEALARAVEAERVAAEAYEAARAKRAAEGPELTRRRHQLEQALALEPALAEGRQRVADLEDRVAKGQKLTADVAARIASGETALSTLAVQESDLRTQLSAVEVDAEHRARIAEARRLLDRLREAEQALAEAERRLALRRQQLAEARQAAEQARAAVDAARQRQAEHERELERLEGERPADEEELRSQEGWLSRAEEQIRAVAEGTALLRQRQAERAERQREAARLAGEAEVAAAEEARLRQVLETARRALDEARARLEEAKRHEHAVALIQSLTPGEPCPVCGSREHPAPAVPDSPVEMDGALAAVAGSEQAVRQAEQGLERAVRQRADAEGRVATAAHLEEEAGRAIVQAEALVEAARSRLPESWRALVPEALPGALEREQAEQAGRKQRYQAWQLALTELRQRRDDQARSAAEAAAEASAREATAQAAARSLAETEAEAAAQAEATEERRREFDQARGDHDAAAIEAEQRRIEGADREANRLRQALDKLRQEQQAQEQALGEDRKKHQDYVNLLHQRQLEQAQARQRLEEAAAQYQSLSGGQPAAPQLQAVEQALQRLEKAESESAGALERAREARGHAGAQQAAGHREEALSKLRLAEAEEALLGALRAAAFTDAAAAAAALRSPERQAELERQVTDYEREGDRLQSRQTNLTAQLDGRSLTEADWLGWQERREGSRAALAHERDERARARQVHDDLLAKQKRWQELEEQRESLSTGLNHLEELKALLRGNAFVDFLAEEQMARVAAEASVRLGQLTRHRYGLETESGGGFAVRDDANGGARRAVTTLSGGETFLTSLSLALALSAQIQLRGHFPLEFFFLDEGFGTLDPDLLDVVISTLERLHFENLHVGVISHVPELRSRLQRRVIVEPATPGGRGSRVVVERL